ncbi:MAG: hypothetical protein AB2L24_00965 [Mangrovibacterium sp.]
MALQIFLVFGAKSQNTPIMEPNEKIQSLTIKYLVPSCKQGYYDEVIRYIEEPSCSQPEFAISLQHSDDSSILELIAFKKSLSDQIMKKIVENNRDTVFETDTVNYSLTISFALSKKLERLINYLVNTPYKDRKINEVPLDGTSYSFYIFGNDGTKTLMFHSSQQDVLRAKVIKLFSQLSQFIKIRQIDEIKTIAIIDEILDK